MTNDLASLQLQAECKGWRRLAEKAEARIAELESRAEKEADLVSERERVKSELAALATMLRENQRCEERDRDHYDEKNERPHPCRLMHNGKAAAYRHAEANLAPILAALSPSPVEGEECERCWGKGFNFGTERDGMLRCEGCHGTGRKQPESGIGADGTARPSREARGVGGNPLVSDTRDALEELAAAVRDSNKEADR